MLESVPITGSITSCDTRRKSVSFGMFVIMAAAVFIISPVVEGNLAMGNQTKKKSNGDPALPTPSDKKDSDKKAPLENPFPNRLKAPSLDGGTGWLNTSGEITLKDLRGKVVLLDFWTYCCINCMHVLPDLKYLEKKYAKEVVVIGVHSAKFDNEKDSENIRRAIQRYEIEHPVINDSRMTVWRKFGARSWPTLVMIDPEGFYCGYISGEGNREILDAVVGKLIAYHKAKGTLDETPIRFDLERAKLKPLPLRFPGKVLADEKGNRLFIADSNHNRLVVSTLEGKLIEVIGTGAIGAKDGPYDQARFDHPQGLALVGNTLYVADTENHLIRAVDLTNKTVSTLAGVGKQARRRVSSGKLKETALNSPWALKHIDGVLYIAMAGPHQVWQHQLGSKTLGVYAGSGREDILNGPLNESALAQPSALATDGKSLFVADSEGSSIRKISLGSKGTVTTIAGTFDLPQGRCLFEFGDRDGVGNEARLQHPLGLVYHDNVLYVADTYNHKIKKITPEKDGTFSKVTTWLGDGTSGDRLDPPRFFEPGGLTIAVGKLFIADTNNHRVLTVDLKTDAIAELKIDGLVPPDPQDEEEDSPAAADKFAEVKPQVLKFSDSIPFEVKLTLPEGYKLNKLAPVSYKITANGKQTLIAANQLGKRRRAKVDGTTARFTLPLASKLGSVTLQLSVTYSFCRDGVGGLCKLKTSRWKIPVEISLDAKQKTVQLAAGSAE